MNDKVKIVYDNHEQPSDLEDTDNPDDNFDQYPSDLPLDFTKHPCIREEIEQEVVEDEFQII